MPGLEGKETNSSPLPIAYRKGEAAFLPISIRRKWLRFDGRANAVCTSELGRMFCSDEGACVGFEQAIWYDVKFVTGGLSMYPGG